MKTAVRVAVAILSVGIGLHLAVLAVFDHKVDARAEQLRTQARAEFARALPDRRAQAEHLRKVSVSGVGYYGRPTSSWSELVCELRSEDGGWVVLQYLQVCELTTVDLIPTKATGDADCQWREDPDGVDPTVDWQVDVVYAPAAGLLDPVNRWCPAGIVTAPADSRMESGARPSDLSSSPAWIVVQTRTPVTRTELGCRPWSFLFCQNPLDGVVLPA